MGDLDKGKESRGKLKTSGHNEYKIERRRDRKNVI